MEMQHANWIAQAREHWKEFLPEMFDRLTKAGTLEKALTEAAEATANSMRVLMTQGFKAHEAWEMVREEHLFLPEEDGASEEAPPSEGYLAQVELMKGWSSLGLPED